MARKRRACGGKMEPALLLQYLSRFEASLHEATFAGVVLDYDGTVVATARRFEEIEPAMAAELNRLLGAGLLLGIATGRGKSVHEKLRAAISSSYWSQCTVGYYNGGTIRTLADHCNGLAEEAADPAIAQADVALRSAPELAGAAVDMRPRQITVTRSECDEHGLWMKVRCVLERAELATLKVVHSSHSVDVVPFQVSKSTFVQSIAHAAHVSEKAIVKIGDRGRWPGNDADLLAMSHGLSVDEVSGDPGSCWNLAPLGLSGPAATLYYLQHIEDGRYRPAGTV
jgi:hydroxymethylpyrimidine pyrophosphatase-like HAD family hydrolase